MKFLMVSCKKATFLLSKKEENKLSWLDGIRLKSHMLMCELCRRFEKQSEFIAKHAHQENQPEALSQECKENIKKVLQDN